MQHPLCFCCVVLIVLMSGSLCRAETVIIDCLITPDIYHFFKEREIKNTQIKIIHPGCFLSHPLFIDSNTSLSGEKGAQIQQTFTLPDTVGVINISSGDSTRAVSNVQISGISFIGGAEKNGFAEHNPLISIFNAHDVTLSNLNLTGFRGDGVYVGQGNVVSNHHIVIRNVIFDGVNFSNRNGISIIDGHDILIDGNRFTRISRKGMPGSIDLEPNTSLQRIYNIMISRNHFTDVHGMAAIVISLRHAGGTVPDNVTIKGNIFDKVVRGILIKSAIPKIHVNNNFHIFDNRSSFASKGDYSICNVNAATGNNLPAIEKYSDSCWKSLRINQDVLQ